MSLQGLSNLTWPARGRPRGSCPEWSESLATGHLTIDAEHKQLIALLAATYHALGDDELPKEQVCATVKALDVFAREHFAYEEKILDLDGIDAGHRDAHRAAHRSFLSNIAVVMDGAGRMPPDVCGELMDFLSLWLVSHVRHMDHKLALLCKDLGISESDLHPRDAA